MDCPRCGASAAATQKFCGECGVALAGVFSATGPTYARMPKHLAEKVLLSRDSLLGERKQVTVLFADIKGSLELLADRDPEEVRHILDPLLERMMEGVHHYEGTVNQVLGDGIMAIFGAPLAREDHAMRACYAALRIQQHIDRSAQDMRRAHGVAVQVRIGINSGEVVVRSIASDLHMDYTAVGQATHLAARMEQIAAPGSILLTADTLRLTEGYIEVSELGPVPIKGMPGPVEVFELIGAGPTRSRLQAAAARGLTPFVGRAAELRVLRAALAKAAAHKAQIVALSGEPGVGKSRLVHEFVHSQRTADWLVLESTSVSYGRATPYLPVIELLRSYFQIDTRDSVRTINEKVTGKMLTLDTSLQAAVPPVLDLLEALPAEHSFHLLDPLQHRQHTYEAVIRLLLAESRVQPLLVAFEDLHWNDSLTLGLLTSLIGAGSDAPLLLIVSYRPEHRDEWSRLPNWRHLRLAPLEDDTVAELLRVLMGSDPSLEPLSKLLLERTGGNPFFIEELVRSLMGSGVIAGPRGRCRLHKPISSIQVPPTVQAVLAARIDHLQAPQKRLLQEAAVIGNDAPLPLLQAVSGLGIDDLRSRLDAIQAAELLYVTQMFPELQYSFRHSLTHEVAYAGLLLEDRRSIHARIVEAMEALYADRLSEQVERIAGHAMRGQLGEKAFVYLRQAGTKAAERQAYPEAMALFKQAESVLADIADGPHKLELALDLRFDMRNVLQPMGERARIAECLRDAEALALQLDDPRRSGWVQSYLTEHFWMLGRYAEAVEAGTRALATGRHLGELALQVVTNLPLGLAHHTRGDYRKSIECFDWNVARLEGDQLRERFGMFVLPSTFSRGFIAWSHAELGEFARGTVVGEEALAIAEAASHPFSCGYALLCLGVLQLRQGDLRRAIPSLRRALTARAFAESPVGFAYVALHLGYALALDGHAAEGLPVLEKSIAIAESKHFVARHALRLSYLAEIHLVLNRTDDAAIAATRSLELARAHDERGNQAYALHAMGIVALRQEQATRALGHFQSALQLAVDLEMRPLQARCRLGLACSLEATGQHAAAAASRASAQTMADEMQMRLVASDRLYPGLAERTIGPTGGLIGEKS